MVRGAGRIGRRPHAGLFYQPEADAAGLSIPGGCSTNHTPRGNWFLGAPDVVELACETLLLPKHGTCAVICVACLGLIAASTEMTCPHRIGSGLTWHRALERAEG